MSQTDRVEHLFRHEYGKLVALLLRRFGVQHLDAIEDAVQWAMAQALDFWCRDSIPDAPSAWLYRVAYRHLISEFRTTQRRNSLITEHLSTLASEVIELEEASFAGEMSDSMLRMMFITGSDAIPIESQLVFTLKSLCGFSIREIALRLFITEANVYKRFSRAKAQLKTQTLELDMLSNDQMLARLPSVHRVLYLLFTEGYLSSHNDTAIRRDLCEEAIRLTSLLAASNVGDVPAGYALLALMHFHLARISTRQDEFGSLLLLEQQDRHKWNKQQITLAMTFLAQSANGDIISRYHVEASIAAEHCLSPSFSQTPWEKIVASYELLHNIAPSALHRLNQAIATAEWKGPEAGLAVLKSTDFPEWLGRSYHWYTVYSDLLLRSGEITLGRKYADLAIATAPTDSIKRLLSKRLLER
ncbi:MAG: sigma-70 family RNA polymerase sigma factor [Oceanospirillaceae bacterium]|nr:sigma-70 family RNA polymerase sigma factor [Oceanospirillaceae bacterium]